MISGLLPYTAYKESGQPGLGQVPRHWGLSPLAGLARLKSVVNQAERQLLSVYLQRGVVRFVDVDEKRTNGTSEDLSKYQAVDPGDFVLNNQQAWRGSVGVSEYSGIVSPAYLVLSLSPRFSARYANLLFRDQSLVSQYLICSKGVGTIQRNLYWPHLKRVAVVVPPPDEQAAIVRFLDWANGRLERAIRAKRKVIALRNEQKQAIIHRAVTRGLDPDVPLKPSGIPWLGDIPQHWETWPLRRCISIRSGDFADPIRLRSECGETYSIPVVGGNGVMGFADRKNNEGVTIVIGRVGALCGNVHLISGNAWITDNALRITRISGFEAGYLAEQLRVMNLNRLSNANAQPLITGSAVKSQRVARPPPEEQGLIASRLTSLAAPIVAAISRLEREIELLREYRTRLVADVVTGKLDVREAAASLPDEAAPDLAGDDAKVAEEFDSEAEGAAA